MTSDSGYVTRRITELESALEDMTLTMQEADQAVESLESKIAIRRSRNPLEPIPFELFSEFCLDWIEKCKMATETVRFKLRKSSAELQVKRQLVDEKQKLAGSDSLAVDHESLTIQKKDNERNLQDVTKTSYELRLMGGEVKRDTTREKIKLGETMQQYGQIGADCVKLEQNLGELEEQIDRTEREIEELEAVNQALREKAQLYKVPSVIDIARKIEELEQVEKQLVDVVKEKVVKYGK
ncbi:hypothetical protein RP20_CCG025202 [Aedes albopictus]|nr:hypothetical protein RP20_CCG025202 [Aedes albopictus]